MKVTQRVLPTGPFYDRLRKTKDFDVTIDFNCQSLVNPLSDVSKFVGSSGDNYASLDDPKIEELYKQMNESGEPSAQRAIMRDFEKRVLDDEGTQFVTLWWYRIVPHRSYVRGWKISPSRWTSRRCSASVSRPRRRRSRFRGIHAAPRTWQRRRVEHAPDPGHAA
jgi:peptide/nickel transport system substrate-binding protein